MNPLRHLQRKSVPTVISLVALFFAMSGTAVAATGGNFILGKANTANSVSSLTNTNGTALSLSSNASTPALKVSNSVQVPNLNASELGGIGPAGFVQGGGHVLTAEVELTVGQSNVTLLNLPHYGKFTATCLSVPFAEVDFTVGPDPVHLWTQDISGTSPGVGEQDMSSGSGLGLQTGVTPEQTQWTIQDARSPGLSGHLASVQTDETVNGNNTSKCDFALVAYAAP
jgi:hypothetical protein